MKSTQVLLLFGGESTEHDVSIMSARNIYDAVDKSIFTIQLGYIDTSGKWYLLDNFDDYHTVAAMPRLIPLLGESTFAVGEDKLRVDVILPVLHGKNGEDGSVQALAQLLHIPIVGCDMTSSTASMDKIIAKRIAAQIGIGVVPYEVCRAGQPRPEYQELRAKLGEVLFVKPSRAGSSVGVNKVHSNTELQQALDEALEVGDTVLIERALEVRELEVAVLGTPPMHLVSRVGEIIPGQDFYSYEDKYDKGSASTSRIPANISTAASEQIQACAKLLFTELGANGLARVDFFLTNKDEIYFNEINTLPGFTDVSMYPALWQDAGISYDELLTKLIMQTAR